jgi:hypothetical protein
MFVFLVLGGELIEDGQSELTSSSNALILVHCSRHRRKMLLFYLSDVLH